MPQQYGGSSGGSVVLPLPYRNLLAPPSLASLTVHGNTHVDSTVSGDYLQLVAHAINGHNLACYDTNLPAGDCTLTVGMIGNVSGNNWCSFGIHVRNSTNQAARALLYLGQNSGVQVMNYTNDTTAPTGIGGNTNLSLFAPCFFRCKKVGGTLTWTYSPDNVNYLLIKSDTSHTDISADKIGFCIDNYNSALDTGITVIHYNLTTP